MDIEEGPDAESKIEGRCIMSLEIINLCKSFGDKKLFDGFSYSFSDTGIYAVIGESGIGKTTLLRMISGLDTDYTGEIIGGGIGRVSFAFQEYRLFPGLSAIENLIFTISDRKDGAVFDKCKKMLLTLGFTDNDINLLPEQMSGGMKQRVSIARAILFDTPILILDEPTKELDRQNRDAVIGLIQNEAKRRLIILVSHSDEDISALGAIKIHI